MPIEPDRKRLKCSFIQGAIPDDLRSLIWKLICRVDVKRHQYNRELYQKLLDEPLPEEDEFCIGKDLTRTISGMAEFKLDPGSGKNRLYNVLKASANFDKEVGYCQGINYLAAFFILNIEEDEDAFWCLEELLQGRHRWREIFMDDTPRLLDLLGQIEEKLKKKCPKVLKHLVTTTQLNVPAAFSSLFITLFVYDLPREVAVRVFELFLLEGEALLIKLLVRMVKHKQKQILALQELELLKYIRSDMIQECLKEKSLKELLKK